MTRQPPFAGAERAPWGNDFPAIVRNDDLGTLKEHPTYEAAKQGDARAGLSLARDLLTSETVEAVRELASTGPPPRLMPVIAEEANGRNSIPLMVAETLAYRLGWEVEHEVVQAHKVSRTGKGADYRLAHHPGFAGEVDPAQRYLLIDDTLSMGGTLATLRGYIENREATVMGGMVMTAHPGAVNLPVKAKMLAAIEAKHGAAMNALCEDYLGHGLSRLTQGEAGHFKAAASVAAMEARLVAQGAVSRQVETLYQEADLLFLALGQSGGPHVQEAVASGRAAISHGRPDELEGALRAIHQRLPEVSVSPIARQQMASLCEACPRLSAPAPHASNCSAMQETPSNLLRNGGPNL